MDWKCNKCGNKTTAEKKPSICENADCAQTGTYEPISEKTKTPTARGWRCGSCDNKIMGPFAPSICPNCHAHDSYVPID
ncbi:MAG: hypothetical protein B7C24_09690 [Bacteroidetes bacterium 4572_77]|nr:MAG: hypothetical protein B7C24_09690 [Bacteroidetes bacterium 4572_77]